MNEYEHACREMLAVLHGDGGHYHQEHGLDKAYKDAMQKYYDRLEDFDAQMYKLTKENNELGEKLKEIAEIIR